MAKQYKNYMEQVVEGALREYMKSETQICSCEQCAADMAALALNQLNPHYATTARGASFLDNEQKSLEFIVKVVSAVKNAAERVKQSPRHPLGKK